MSSLWMLLLYRSFRNNKSVQSALSNIRYAEAVDEVNAFYLEKHGRVTAAAVKATEEKR